MANAEEASEETFEFQRVNNGTVVLPRFSVSEMYSCVVEVVVVGSLKAIAM